MSRGSCQKDLTADLGRFFKDRDVEALLSRGTGRHETGRTGADDDDVAAVSDFRRLQRELELVAGPRVDGTLSGQTAGKGVAHHGLEAVQAGQAAVDFLRTAFFRFLDPVRIGKQRAAQSDGILIAFFQKLFRLFRSTDDAGMTDRNVDSLFDGFTVVFTPAKVEGRRFTPGVHAVVGTGRQFEMLDAVAFQFLGDLHTVFEGVANIVAEQTIVLICGKTCGNGIVRSAELVDLVDDVLDDAKAIVKGSAVFIGTMVGIRGNELLQEIAVRAMQLNAVDAGLLTAQGALCEFIFQFVDLPLGEFADLLGLIDGRAGQICRNTAGSRNRAGIDLMQEGFLKVIEILRHAEEQFPPTVPAAADDIRQFPDHDDQLIRLTARVMQLYEDFGTFLMDRIGQLRQSGDAAVRSDRQLSRAGAAGPVTDSGDLGLDEANTALGALGIILDAAVTGSAVQFCHFQQHGNQRYAVRDLASADVEGLKEFWIEFVHYDLLSQASDNCNHFAKLSKKNVQLPKKMSTLYYKKKPTEFQGWAGDIY